MIDEHGNQLAHYGVKGMRWGVRKSRTGATEEVARQARGDARETVWAEKQKGRGSGSTRKSIKNRVDKQKQASDSYKREFDAQLAAARARSRNSQIATKATIAALGYAFIAYRHGIIPGADRLYDQVAPPSLGGSRLPKMPAQKRQRIRPAKVVPSALRADQTRRNGAHAIREMLKKMGEDVI